MADIQGSSDSRPHFASTGAQTKALIQKSWVFQKRNIGSNICLCAAPIFFCVVLALIQVAVNRVFLNSDNLKCGCFCEQCCPTWALTTSSNNYTADGSGKITVTNPAVFGSLINNFPPSAVTSLPNGQFEIQTCGPVNSGSCPTELDFKCLKTDGSRCGLQYSSPAQAQWCAVPSPSAWPAVVQVPDEDRRAKPWGATLVSPPGVVVPRAPALITAASASSAQVLGAALYPGDISDDPALWTRVLGSLYSGSVSSGGNVFNGDVLSLLGFQFGTNADPQLQVYIERAFQAGDGLYVMVPSSACVDKGIKTNSTTCMPDFLRLWFGSNSAAQPFLFTLPNCTGGSGDIRSGGEGQLLSATDLRVVCTEAAVIPQPSAAQLEDRLYCGYRQARCNLSNPINNDYMASYDFHASGAASLNLDMYTNTTDADGGGGPPRAKRLPGALTAAVSAWWRTTHGGDAAAGAGGSAVDLLGVMSMPKAESRLKLEFSSLLGPLFYSWVVQLLLPTFLQQLVYEKEKRLRMMMKMHGLGDTVYWLVTYAWYLLLYCVYIIIFILFGAAVQLSVFRKTSIGIQIIFYFLFGNCMIAFAFMLSSLFTSARTAVVVAFLYVFASGLIGELLLSDFMGDGRSWLFFVEWVPAWALYRGLYEQAQYTFLGVYRDELGMQFANLSDKGNGMAATWGIFAVEWALFLCLGWYFEQVLNSGTGARRRPLFFIEWLWRKPLTAEQLVHAATQRRSIEAAHAAAASSNSNVLAATAAKAAAADELRITVGSGAGGSTTARVLGKITATAGSLSSTEDERSSSNGGVLLADVEAEAARVARLADFSHTPIVVKDIQKVYPGLDGGKPKMAVKQLTLGIERGECFGLLGPNGAGKTTTLNMLTGFLEPTTGTAVVEGYDIRTNIQAIYKLMGVCPQHDLLWEQLSAREHLRFYGRLKGLTGKELEAAIDTALKSVNLYNAGVGDKLCGRYSGGMKRRLSVAISFIGQPKVVYLDEPSTGLDPASRRGLWEVVKSNKQDRAIILTTHSMEEAEQLCDRLGIFVDGQLVCIGNPKEITARYAGFLVFTITVPAEQEADARALVASLSPNAVLTYALGGTLKYELPSHEVSLSRVFAAVEAAKAPRGRLSVVDWGVANATLEEVFIKLAKSIGASSSDT